MNPSSSLDRWNDELRLLSFCPVCERHVHPTHARILDEEGQARLVHVQCQRCRHTMLAVVLVNQVGASSVGMLTDLSYEDVMKFRMQETISVDDVINVHTSLENEDWKGFFFSTHKQARIKKRPRS